MKRLTLVAAAVLVLAVQADAQDTAKTEITIKISAKTPSFTDQRLVVMLYHDHVQADRGNTTVDRYVDTKFSHEMGKETVLVVTLGEKAKLKPDVRYLASVAIFTKDTQRTHFGELKGRDGPHQLTNARKLTLEVRPVPAKR